MRGRVGDKSVMGKFPVAASGTHAHARPPAAAPVVNSRLCGGGTAAAKVVAISETARDDGHSWCGCATAAAGDVGSGEGRVCSCCWIASASGGSRTLW